MGREQTRPLARLGQPQSLTIHTDWQALWAAAALETSGGYPPPPRGAAAAGAPWAISPRAIAADTRAIPLQHLPSHSMPALTRVLAPPAHVAFFAARLPPWALSRRAHAWPCPVGPTSTSAV